MLDWGEQGWDVQVWSYARVSAFASYWGEARPVYERARSCFRALADPRTIYPVARALMRTLDGAPGMSPTAAGQPA